MFVRVVNNNEKRRYRDKLSNILTST